jgi:hypothetical protein
MTKTTTVEQLVEAGGRAQAVEVLHWVTRWMDRWDRRAEQAGDGGLFLDGRRTGQMAAYEEILARLTGHDERAVRRALVALKAEQDAGVLEA